jgi:hypothetical protein
VERRGIDKASGAVTLPIKKAIVKGMTIVKTSQDTVVPWVTFMIASGSFAEYMTLLKNIMAMTARTMRGRLDLLTAERIVGILGLDMMVSRKNPMAIAMDVWRPSPKLRVIASKSGENSHRNFVMYSLFI